MHSYFKINSQLLIDENIFEPPYYQCIRYAYQEEVIRYVFHIINNQKNQLILYEALRILAHLGNAATDKVIELVQSGLFPLLNKLLRSEGIQFDIHVEMCWVLANLANDDKNDQIRLQLIKDGALDMILNIIKKQSESINDNLMEVTIYAFGNYFLNFNKQYFQYYFPSVLILCQWFQLENLKDGALNNICRAFSLITSRVNDDQLQKIVDLGIIPRFIQLCNEVDYSIVNSNKGLASDILLIFNNILTVLPKTLDIIAVQLLPCLENLIEKQDLKSELRNILETFQIISTSNIYCRKLLLKNTFINYLKNCLESQNQNQILLIFSNILELINFCELQKTELKIIWSILEIYITKKDSFDEHQLQLLKNLKDCYLKYFGGKDCDFFIKGSQVISLLDQQLNLVQVQDQL